MIYYQLEVLNEKWSAAITLQEYINVQENNSILNVYNYFLMER